MITARRSQCSPLAARQRDIGEDLRRATEHRGTGVDTRVPGHHADVLGAEVPAQREELFVDERLDGTGIDGALTRAERLEMEGCGDERFSRTGRGVENHIVSGEDLQDCLLLLRVHPDAPARHDGGEPLHHDLRSRATRERRQRWSERWDGRHFT